MAKEEKAGAKAPAQASATAGQPDSENKTVATKPTINLEQDAGVGSESFGREDLAIPRVSLLQSGSEQVKKSTAKHIAGSEEGDICDLINSTIYKGDKGILVVPISYRRAYLEWKDRQGEGKGGFVADHGSDDIILKQTTKNDRNQDVMPNGNIIVPTAEYFVFLVDPDGRYNPYVLSMSGSQLKKARQWNTIMNQLKVEGANGLFNPAMFFKAYRLTTVPETNDKGNWFGWKIVPESNTLDLPGGEGIYLAAREFRKQVAEGNVKASAPQESEHTSVVADNEKDPL